MITDDWSDDEDGDEPLSTWFPQVVIACLSLCSCLLQVMSLVTRCIGSKPMQGKPPAMACLLSAYWHTHLENFWCTAHLGCCTVGTGFVAGSWRQVVFGSGATYSDRVCQPHSAKQPARQVHPNLDHMVWLLGCRDDALVHGGRPKHIMCSTQSGARHRPSLTTELNHPPEVSMCSCEMACQERVRLAMQHLLLHMEYP
jgi:hypothetical protein